MPARTSISVKAPGISTPSFVTRGDGSVDNGLDGAVLLDAGAGNFAFHADAFGRKRDDYRIPRYPYLTAPDPADAPNATQPGASTAGSRIRRCAPTDSRSAAPTSSTKALSASR